MQIQGGKFAVAQGQVEYRGRLSTLGMTIANTDLINESGVAVMQFLRRITPRFEFVCYVGLLDFDCILSRVLNCCITMANRYPANKCASHHLQHDIPV